MIVMSLFHTDKMYVCVCVVCALYTLVHECLVQCVCLETRKEFQVSNALLYLSPPYILRQGLSLNLEFTFFIWAGRQQVPAASQSAPPNNSGVIQSKARPTQLTL